MCVLCIKVWYAITIRLNYFEGVRRMTSSNTIDIFDEAQVVETLKKFAAETDSQSEQAMLAMMIAKIPVMLVGAPGTTKTATIRALAERLGYVLITIVPSRMDPQDLSGFPTRGDYQITENGVTRTEPITEYAPQIWQKQIMEKKRVILFLDEFSNAHPSVRASLLSFIQDRQFPNGEYFPSETILVGAMNPTDSAADGYELDKATTNRIGMISWNPDNDKWLKGMVDNWGRGARSDGEKHWRSLIVKFLNDSRGFIHRENDAQINTGEAYGNFDVSNASDRTVIEGAWASRRSWDNLSFALAHVEDPVIQDTISCAIVGVSATSSFRTWLHQNGSISVKDLLKDPESYNGWDTMSGEQAKHLIDGLFSAANSKNINAVLDVFDQFIKYGKQAFMAGHLPAYSGILNGLKLTTEERDKLRGRLLQSIKEYKLITDQSRSVKSVKRS